MLHVKKEDRVKVVAGKDSGKIAKVLRVFPNRQRAIVEGLNMLRRHTRPNPQRNIKGGIVEREAPLHVSNLLVICPECGEAARMGFTALSDGRKVRVCRKCKATVDK